MRALLIVTAMSCVGVAVLSPDVIEATPLPDLPVPPTTTREDTSVVDIDALIAVVVTPLPPTVEPAPEPAVIAEPPVPVTSPPDGPVIPPPRNQDHDVSLRVRALNRFIALGAVQWMINVFDCLGWHESGWTNVRNAASGDDGWAQINDIHDPQLAAQGLDPYVPEDAATFSWQLSRQGTRFTPWVVAPACGV